MDSALIHKILMSMRGGGGQDVSNAGMQPAPQSNTPGLDQAYSQPMAPAMQQSQGQSPFQFNPGLEQQAQGMNNQLEPIVQQIMQRLGLMNMIRNRSNQTMTQG